MAVSVGRVQRRTARVERALRYGARLTAVVAYASAVAVAYVLFAPLLRGDVDSGTSLAPPPDPRLTVVRQGETLADVAARHGISVARLLALNPDLRPLGLEPYRTLRVG